MDNFCKNCGAKLDDGIMYCPQCGLQIYDNGTLVKNNTNQSESIENKKKENKYIITIIALYAIGIILMFLPFTGKFGFAFTIYPFFFLTAFIMTIYAKVKIRGSKKIKLIFNFSIGMLVVAIVCIILIFITCNSMIQSMQGCN